jgi:hypothetical protein
VIFILPEFVEAVSGLVSPRVMDRSQRKMPLLSRAGSTVRFPVPLTVKVPLFTTTALEVEFT